MGARTLLRRLGFAASLLRGAAITAVFVGVVFLVWREIHEKSVYIEPISVPPELVTRGLTSAVVTGQVIDRASEIVREMGSPNNAPELRTAAETPEFHVVTFGPSMQAMGREIRRALGRQDTQISGALTKTSTGWRLVFRNTTKHVATSLDVPDDDGRETAIIDAGATGILRHTDPKLLSHYQYSIYNRTLDPAKLAPLEATLDFREHIGGERDERSVRSLRAFVTFERGDFAKAQNLWLSLARDHPDAVDYSALAAMAARVGGRIDEANFLLTAIVQSSESRPQMLGQAGSQLLSLGRPRDALELSFRMLRADPDNAWARRIAGIALVDLHRARQAVDVLQGSMPKVAESAMRTRVALARAYASLGDAGNVSAIREQLSKAFPGDNLVNLVAALDAETQGDLTVALAAYKALKGDLTSDSGSSLGQGRVLLKQGRAAEALPHFENHLRREPANIEGHWQLAKAWDVIGRIDAAQAEYAKVVAADPDHVAALQEWARLLAKAGNVPKAEEKLALAAEADRRLSVPIAIPPLVKR